MKEVSVNCVVRMLKKRSVTAKETRIKYAFLALLASVVLPTTHTPRISHEHAEKIKDLDAFLAYPWGRISFELLISSIKERNELSLSQNTIALKGFVLALQLVMIEAVPALTKAVHEAGSSGSEGDFADDDELSEEERKGKRSISPGHARDTDCSGKAGVVSIISVGNEAVNGDSQFGWSDDEEDVDVVRMREETRSEAEIRKTTKQKSNQSSSDVVDADSIASCVKGRLSGDLSRVSEELNRVSAEVSRMATELKSFGAAFKSFQTAIVSKVDDMLKTFHGQTVQNITNPMIHSPAPAMQHVPPPVAVSILTSSYAKVIISFCPLTSPQVRRTGEDQSKYSHVGVNDVVNQPTASSHGGLDASKIIENALRFAEKECFPLSNVETVGVNPTMHTIGNARVNGSEPSPNFSSAEEEPILDPGLVFPKPTFSLGLSQEEPNNESSGCDVVNEESLVIALNKDNGVTVAEGDAPCHPFRKSKRQKVVPKALVGDYECDNKFLTRAWEAHVAANRTGDDMEVESKFCKLRDILKTPFSFIINEVRIESKDLSVLVEKSGQVPAKVVNVLIHHTRSVYNSASDQITANQAVFFDTKFVCQFPRLMEGCSSVDAGCRLYFPFNLDKTHWVCLCIDATSWQLHVLDCNISIRSDVMMCKEIAPIAVMLTYLLRQAGKQICGKEVKALPIDRPHTVPQLENQLYSAVNEVLLIQAHAFGGLEICKCISPNVVESELQRLAVTIVERYHGII
ncbi:hypothetical protein Bca4012_076456 [Brassica carinata]